MVPRRVQQDRAGHDRVGHAVPDEDPHGIARGPAQICGRAFPALAGAGEDETHKAVPPRQDKFRHFPLVRDRDILVDGVQHGSLQILGQACPGQFGHAFPAQQQGNGFRSLIQGRLGGDTA